MSRAPRNQHEERRRLFRKMEWVFVYAPPILAVFIGVFGAAFLAFFVPLRGTSFWERWALGAGLLLGAPLIGYLIRDWWQKR